MPTDYNAKASNPRGDIDDDVPPRRTSWATRVPRKTVTNVVRAVSSLREDVRDRREGIRQQRAQRAASRRRIATETSELHARMRRLEENIKELSNTGRQAVEEMAGINDKLECVSHSLDEKVEAFARIRRHVDAHEEEFARRREDDAEEARAHSTIPTTYYKHPEILCAVLSGELDDPEHAYHKAHTQSFKVLLAPSDQMKKMAALGDTYVSNAFERPNEFERVKKHDEPEGPPALTARAEGAARVSAEAAEHQSGVRARYGDEDSEAGMESVLDAMNTLSGLLRDPPLNFGHVKSLFWEASPANDIEVAERVASVTATGSRVTAILGVEADRSSSPTFDVAEMSSPYQLHAGSPLSVRKSISPRRKSSFPRRKSSFPRRKSSFPRSKSGGSAGKLIASPLSMELAHAKAMETIM